MGHRHSRYRYGNPYGSMPYSNYNRMPISHPVMQTFSQPRMYSPIHQQSVQQFMPQMMPQMMSQMNLS